MHYELAIHAALLQAELQGERSSQLVNTEESPSMPKFRVHLRDGQVLIIQAPSSDAARHAVRSEGTVAKVKLARNGR